jgi:hypothetical protein
MSMDHAPAPDIRRRSSETVSLLGRRSVEGVTINRQPQKTIKDGGGARRDRTDDLMLAKHALSQLSYGPSLLKEKKYAASAAARVALAALSADWLVNVTGPKGR